MPKICNISTPLWILPFSTFEKSCFTEIIVAKLSFRILNFLIPIHHQKSLNLYFMWSLEFFGLNTLIWETRVYKVYFCFLETCQITKIQFDLLGLAQKFFPKFWDHCDTDQITPTVPPSVVFLKKRLLLMIRGMRLQVITATAIGHMNVVTRCNMVNSGYFEKFFFFF